MTRDEIKVNLEQITEQIEKLEHDENQSYAELGRILLPELTDEEGEHAELVARIRITEKRLIALRDDQLSMEADYQKQLIASTCFYCKAVNADGAAFCEECGKRLGEKPREYCDNCGTMNHSHQKFCGECGTKLAELPVSEVTEQIQ